MDANAYSGDIHHGSWKSRLDEEDEDELDDESDDEGEDEPD